MSKNKDQFLTMLVELCRAYDVTYHDVLDAPPRFWHWKENKTTDWSISPRELESAINKEAK